MTSRYEQAREDHEYLWLTYGPAHDMTGGYVDQDDLSILLKSPTKATAADAYENQIHYWFLVGPERELKDDDSWQRDSKVIEIADRYFIEIPEAGRHHD